MLKTYEKENQQWDVGYDNVAMKIVPVLTTY